MARNRELKNIASGIIGSFSSRNNDVDGYWGIGKLYSFASLRKADTVEVDLLNRQISPASENFDVLIEHYRAMLESQLGTEGVALARLQGAIITVSFNQKFQARYHLWGAALGTPYICSCKITDGKGRIHEAIAGGNCRPHDPGREQRSTRVGSFD